MRQFLQWIKTALRRETVFAFSQCWQLLPPNGQKNSNTVKTILPIGAKFVTRKSKKSPDLRFLTLLTRFLPIGETISWEKNNRFFCWHTVCFPQLKLTAQCIPPFLRWQSVELCTPSCVPFASPHAWSRTANSFLCSSRVDEFVGSDESRWWQPVQMNRDVKKHAQFFPKKILFPQRYRQFCLE